MILKGLVLRDYKDTPYATLMMRGLKIIETRKWAWSERGDLVICCGQKSESANKGLALCIVDVFHIEPMRPEHEGHACCKVYPDAKSWFTRNLRVFSKPFSTKGRISGSPMTVFDLDVPDECMQDLIRMPTTKLEIVKTTLF